VRYSASQGYALSAFARLLVDLLVYGFSRATRGKNRTQLNEKYHAAAGKKHMEH
jgi:hypothetical protein